MGSGITNRILLRLYYLNFLHLIPLADRVDELFAAEDLPEDGVVAVQMSGGLAVMHDEELGAAGVATSVRHRQRPALVLVRVVYHFAFDGVARAAGTGAVRAAALGHEARDDAVEGQAVVEAVVCQLLKVFDGARCVGVEQFKFHGAAFFEFNDRFFHM